MSLIKKIFLDLDDVCNDFTPYALKYVGCENYRDNYSWGWNIIAAANALHPTRKFTLKSFWNSFNRGAWASVPESEEFRFLIDLCENLVGKKNICILTSPVDSPGCLDGKQDWIKEHCPTWLHKQFLIGHTKDFCAHPNALLIDDANHNVDAFRIHGGQAILVPRPWNLLHKCNTMKYLQDTFRVLTRQKLRELQDYVW